MTDTLGSVPSVPVQPDAPLGSPANVVTPPTTQATPTPASSAGATGASLADKVSVAANAAPKATPSEVVGAASAASDTVDAAVKSTSIQAFKTATQMAQFLTGKSLDYQNYVWGHASEQVKTLLNTGGYTPPSQQQVSKNPSFWDDIGHGLVSGLDSVRHAASWVGAAAKKSLITYPSEAFNKAGAPLVHLADAAELTVQQGEMHDAATGESMWSPDSILHQLDVSSILHNYNAITNGTQTFQPEALLYVQKELGITGAQLQLLKTYVMAGGQGGPALQQTLATVAPSERVTATNIIRRSPKFQEAANLLADSKLTLGQMLFGGVNANQMKQLYPGFDVKTGKLGAAMNQALGVTAAAGSLATGDPEGDVSLLGSGLEGVGSIRAAGVAGIGAVGSTGIVAGYLTGLTPDAETHIAPFGLKINPLSGIVDGTFSWYTNPLFMGQRALTEYKAGVHGIATLDGWSNTRALRYYLNVGSGRRFASTFAKAITTPFAEDGTTRLSYELPTTPNLFALGQAGIKVEGDMQAVVREAYPKIAADIAAGGDGVAPVAEMMASNQAMINVARGNAGMFFRDATQYPHITLPQSVLESFKGVGRTAFSGRRFNPGALSPRELAADAFGQAATQDGLEADLEENQKLGPAARFMRRAVALAPERILKLSEEKGGTQLERLLSFSLPDADIARITNHYNSIPPAEIFLRRQVALAGIRDMMLAAGVDRSSAGQDWLQGWMNRENYSFGANAHYANPMNPDGPLVASAIRDNQISNTIALPDVRELYKFSKKSWFMDKLQMGVNADVFDKFMSQYWKRAMLLRPGFAIRVSLEEVLNFMLRHGATSYINSRVVSSLYDTANTMKELKAAHELINQKEAAAVMGDEKAANLVDAARLRDALLGDMPEEMKQNIKTPEEFLASVAGWRGINFLRRVGLKMQPEFLLRGAYELAKRGVLDSGYQEHIDAVTGHGDVFLGDVPNGKEDSGLILENGQHIMFARTGVLKEYTPGETQSSYGEFVPHWQMELSGLAGSKMSRAAANGYLNGGDDGALQGVKDFINAKQLRADLAKAEAETDPEYREVATKAAQKELDYHEDWLKNFAGHYQTRDGRVVATGQASQDEATHDWARAIVDDLYSLTFTRFEQEQREGEEGPNVALGPQPIRLPTPSSNRIPYKIGTRDVDRTVQWTDGDHPYDSIIPKGSSDTTPRVRLFQAYNPKTVQEGNAALRNPGRTWFPSYQQALNRAGEDGEVYHINVPIDALKEHYDFNGELTDQMIADMIKDQSEAVSYGGKDVYFESGDVRHAGEDDASANLMVSQIARGNAITERDLRSLDQMHAPTQLLIPATIPKLSGPGDFIAKTMEKGMQYTVGKPLNWMSRQPLFTYNYALGLRDAMDLIKARGIVPEGATDENLLERQGDLAHDIAMDRAMNETLPYIHNPQSKSYMSVVGRNIAPFWFAQEQFYKRWGRLFGTYPEAFYKLSQTMTGLKAVGFVYTDQYGKDAFVYPGSQAVISLLSRTPFGGTLPIEMGLSGEVGGLNPTTASGSVIPVPSLGPLITLPMTMIGGMFPKFVGLANASLGPEAQPIDAGSWPVQMIEQLLPSWATRGLQWIDEQETANKDNITSSLFMSAAIGAAQQLEASGHGLSEQDQKDLTLYNQHLDRIVNWAKNILLFRTIFGFMAPDTPEFKFADNGVGATYQALLNEMPYDEAITELTKLYPNATPETIFESTTSPSGTAAAMEGSGTFVPATQAAGKFINDNETFFKNYSQLAPWTMPAALQKGLFDGSTYTQEKELNLRFGRSLDAWYQEAKYAEGANTYYPLETLVEAAESNTSTTSLNAQTTLGITQAQAQQRLGMPGASEDQIKQTWSQWSTSFKKANPIFADNLTTSGDITNARRNNIVQQLNAALDAGALPKTEWSKQISYMMIAYNKVVAAYTGTDADPGVKGTHMATENKLAFLQWGTAYAKAFPAVSPFFQGVLSKTVPG